MKSSPGALATNEVAPISLLGILSTEDRPHQICPNTAFFER
jgi:hypothetical protein